MTLWPTCVERYDWTTPKAPVTTEIAIATATSAVVRPRFPSGIAVLKSSLMMNAGMTPSADETKMIVVTTLSFGQ
jgi:hypothetical protein